MLGTQQITEHVITSYSIHYTKLYEGKQLDERAASPTFRLFFCEIYGTVGLASQLKVAELDAFRGRAVFVDPIIRAQLAAKGGEAYVAVLKSVVTQASAAIPVMPLYISMSFKIMKEMGRNNFV